MCFFYLRRQIEVHTMNTEQQVMASHFFITQAHMSAWRKPSVAEMQQAIDKVINGANDIPFETFTKHALQCIRDVLEHPRLQGQVDPGRRWELRLKTKYANFAQLYHHGLRVCIHYKYVLIEKACIQWFYEMKNNVKQENQSQEVRLSDVWSSITFDISLLSMCLPGFVCNIT